MAKYEKHFKGNFDHFLTALNHAILSGSISASLEDSSLFTQGDVRCAVHVYERYSYIGGNRVSLNVTLLGKGNDLHLSAIASGGSQAVFFKINTFGENSFLNKLSDFVESYVYRQPSY